MAIKNCRECGHSVSDKARVCPSCGIKKPVGGGCMKYGFISLILITFVPLIGGLFLESPPEADRFSTMSLNVRSGPSTDFDAVSVLSPGEEIFVVNDSLGWIKIKSADDTTKTGWVSKSYTSDLSDKRSWENDQSDAEAERQRAEEAQERERRRAQEAVAWKTEVDKIAAHIMMQDFVKNRLRAPSTAEFPSGWSYDYDRNIDYEGDQVYKIRSWVDAQNSFGAQIRTNYTGRIKQTSKDRWRLLELDMN